MAVRVETTNRLSVGDQVDHDGGKFTVIEAAVWSDALGNYAYTAALLETAGGDGGRGSGGD